VEESAVAQGMKGSASRGARCSLSIARRGKAMLRPVTPAIRLGDRYQGAID
jgi:hypothetical protein